MSDTCLRPFIYAGSVSEREQLRKVFFHPPAHKLKHNHNVLIASYDTVRHDIAHMCQQQWNYCILDEGHLIKSSKTKLSKAIKQLRAAHRLILTGTPIQNNVTELWCLFDFLIPGYLGTEKQFYQKYAKCVAPPPLKSANGNGNANANGASNGNGNGGAEATNSDGIHQTGVLALESLHKQVLPFLLRRTKDEVLNDLPPKIIQDYYCEMSQMQVDLYQDFAESEAGKTVHTHLGLDVDINDDKGQQDEEKAKKKTPPQHAFQALQYLRKVVNHPALVARPEHPRWPRIQSELRATHSALTDIKYSGKLLALRDLLMECGIGVQGGGDETSAASTSIAGAMESDASSTEVVVSPHRVLIFCQLKVYICVAFVGKVNLKSIFFLLFIMCLSTQVNDRPDRERAAAQDEQREPLATGRQRADERTLRHREALQLGSQHRRVAAHDPGGRPRSQLDRRRHGHICRARLESAEGLAGHGPSAPHRSDARRQRLPPHHQEHHRGEDHEVPCSHTFQFICTHFVKYFCVYFLFPFHSNSLQKFKLGIANSVVNIENASLSSMGTEQLMNMFDSRAAAGDTSSSAPKTSSSESETVTSGRATAPATSNYQRMLENIGELWDESQYESEYNMESFLKSLS